MLWRVQYRRALGLIRCTVSAHDRDAAIDRAMRLSDQGYEVFSVGTDAQQAVFNRRDIRRLFAFQQVKASD